MARLRVGGLPARDKVDFSGFVSSEGCASPTASDKPSKSTSRRAARRNFGPGGWPPYTLLTSGVGAQKTEEAKVPRFSAPNT